MEMVGERRKTRPVRIGRVIVGGHAPIAVQSMTTTTPLDLQSSLCQIDRLLEAGCEIVRIAVPSIAAAEALATLRREMDVREWFAPLVADVHFSPRAALEAALHVEKVRINPGNFAPDRSEARRRMVPLIERLRDRDVALRIGVNHGSLANGIVARHGHGPEAMAESALEYLRLCHELGFFDVVVSLKASNPALMACANRLLAARMDSEGFDSPFHIGVTEAGSGRDAEQRSGAGIGALLLDGIGDTLRVSMTGDPAAEIGVCRHILEAAGRIHARRTLYERPARPSDGVHAAPFAEDIRSRSLCPPRVELAFRTDRDDLEDVARAARTAIFHPITPAESILFIEPSLDPDAIDRIRHVLDHLQGGSESLRTDVWVSAGDRSEARDSSADACIRAWLAGSEGAIAGLRLTISEPLAHFSPREIPAGTDTAIRYHLAGDRLLQARPFERDLESHVEAAANLAAVTLAAGFIRVEVSYEGGDQLFAGRRIAAALSRSAPDVALRMHMPPHPWDRAVDTGALLLEGIVEGLSVEPHPGSDSLTRRAGLALEDAYGLLQATRRRFSRTDFISCPGCGRLQFDLEGTARRLRARFGHLRDVKIAVMGCAVNGPGEMADADFGYVGTAGGRVDLYVGGRRASRGLSPEEAEDGLLGLLRERGLWRDPA